MERSVPQQPEAILALGKKIVEELDLADSVDTLGRWMAHYVAELIQQAEQTTDQEQRTATQKVCFETILKLWDHRATALRDIQPLAGLKSAIALLKAANGRDEDNLYWRHDTRNTTYPWIDFVQSLRQMVDNIVLYCVAGSVNEKILNKEKEWVEQHGGFLSDDEQEILEHIDVLLQGGQPMFDQVFLIISEIKELSTEKRQSMIVTKINESLNDQIAKLGQLQTALEIGEMPATDDED